jgi:hypothetical protein
MGSVVFDFVSDIPLSTAALMYIWQLKTAHNRFLKLLSKLFTVPPVWPVIKQTKNLNNMVKGK